MTTGFRVIPSSVTKTWTPRTVTTSSAPTEGRLVDSVCESPIQQLEIKVSFLEKSLLEGLPYLVDEDARDQKWEFAERAWKELNKTLTDTIERFNKMMVEHSRDLSLTNVSILGNAREFYRSEPDTVDGSATVLQDSVTARDINSIIYGRVNTIASTINSSSNSTRRKQSWIRRK